jgi:protein-L-isoaspartate(D-aspartate) O-methyltransferase
MIDVEEREPFVQILEQRLGRTLTPPVRSAFLQVPRHLFVQRYYEQRGNSLSWDLVQATPEKIYRDEALVTRIDERGMPNSSTSQPSVMAAQLETLALEHGQRVLEIGVGTGYNAALLGKIVSDTGQVISIDIDEELVERAKHHLTSADVHNVVALPGDGFLGEAAYAPYDRLLTTCSVRSIPRAWFDQLTIGGRLVGNWLTHLASLFVCVEKTTADELDGGLLDLEAYYMEMRTKDLLPSKQKINWGQYETRTPTRMHLPNIKPLLDNSAYSLLLQCFLPEMRKCYRSRSKDDQMHLYLLTREAAILVQDDGLLIFGDERISQMIQQSFDLYYQLGQPDITEYRVTFQERQAVIRVGGLHFQLPLPEQMAGISSM